MTLKKGLYEVVGGNKRAVMHFGAIWSFGSIHILLVQESEKKVIKAENSSYYVCTRHDGNDKVELPVGIGRKDTTVSHVSRVGLLVVN